MDPGERWSYTMVEVARRLGVHPRTLKRMIDRDEIETFWLGGQRMIRADVVEAILAGKVPPREAVLDRPRKEGEFAPKHEEAEIPTRVGR